MRVSVSKEQKWSTNASITRLGSAYFLLIKILINTDVDPQYGMSHKRSRAAAEWLDGMDTFAKTLPMIVASRSVQLRDCARGSNIPLKKAAGYEVGI